MKHTHYSYSILDGSFKNKKPLNSHTIFPLQITELITAHPNWFKPEYQFKN